MRKGKPSILVVFASIIVGTLMVYVLSIGPATWLFSGAMSSRHGSATYVMIDRCYGPLWQVAMGTKAEKALIVYQDLWFPLKDGPISGPLTGGGYVSGHVTWVRPFRP